jgi:hypothetical protein
MIDTGAGERPGRVGNEARPVFDALVGKLRIPSTRPGSVPDFADRPAGAGGHPSDRVGRGSAGYGKTTLLVQWAERGGQAVAWVSVDEQDNDSKVLLGDVARALDAVRPVARPVFDALASPASSVPGSVVPRLGNAFAAMTVPVLLILDDVRVRHSSECRAALSVPCTRHARPIAASRDSCLPALTHGLRQPAAFRLIPRWPR